MGCGGRAILIIIAVMTDFVNMESEVCPPNQAEIKRYRVSIYIIYCVISVYKGIYFSFRILSPTLPIPSNQLAATIEVSML